jgi:hypothetical protein
VIPGKLAGVRKPTAEELTHLQAAGIGALVSVMDDPSNLDLYQQADIPHLWLPTKGGTALVENSFRNYRTLLTLKTLRVRLLQFIAPVGDGGREQCWLLI